MLIAINDKINNTQLWINPDHITATNVIGEHDEEVKINLINMIVVKLSMQDFKELVSKVNHPPSK